MIPPAALAPPRRPPARRAPWSSLPGPATMAVLLLAVGLLGSAGLAPVHGPGVAAGPASALGGKVAGVPAAAPAPSGTLPPGSGWNFSTPDSAPVDLVAVAGAPGFVAAASTSGNVYLFNITSPQPLGSVLLPASPSTLTISDRGPVLGMASLVLASAGARLYALNLTSPGKFVEAWNFSADLSIYGSNLGAQTIADVAVDAEGSVVAVLTTFTVSGNPGVTLDYLVHGRLAWNYTVVGGYAPAGVGVAMTPDAATVALTLNLQGRSCEAVLFPYFGSPSLTFLWPGTAGTAAASALSDDGTHVFLGGQTGFYVGNTANGQSYGGSSASTFTQVESILTSPSATNYLVETASTLYAFDPPLMTGSAAGPYASPVWSLPVSTPAPRVMLAPDDPAYFLLLGSGSTGSSLEYHYTPMINLSTPAPAYRTVALPSQAISASGSRDLSVVAVGMQHVSGQGYPELSVVFDRGAPTPPSFQVHVFGVSPSGFTVAWGLPGSLVPGFTSLTVSILPLGSGVSVQTLTDPSITTVQFTGLASATPYNVTVVLRSFFGLYEVTEDGSATTFPAPPPVDPFGWAELLFAGLLLAGVAASGILLLRSPQEGPPPPEEEEGGRVRRMERSAPYRSRGRSAGGKGRRTRRSSRLPPGFG